MFLRVVCWVPCCFGCKIVICVIILENTLVGYADDSTLLAGVPKPNNRVQAVLSLNIDFARIGDWC